MLGVLWDLITAASLPILAAVTLLARRYRDRWKRAMRLLTISDEDRDREVTRTMAARSLAVQARRERNELREQLAQLTGEFENLSALGKRLHEEQTQARAAAAQEREEAGRQQALERSSRTGGMMNAVMSILREVEKGADNAPGRS